MRSLPGLASAVSSHLALPPRRRAQVASVATACAAVCALFAGACTATRPLPAPAPAGNAAVAAERAVGAAAGDRTVGIPPFTDAGLPPELAPLAYALADLLATDLARASELRLVERTRLGEVLRELDLAESGRVDPATAPRVGRLVQARTLVLGGASATAGRDGSLRLAVRLADVQSGAVEQAVDAAAPVADILAAEKALAFRVLDALGVTLTPLERAEIERRPTRDLGALLAYGEGLQQEYFGNFRGAADSYRRAQRLDPSFTAAGTRAREARALAEAGTVSPVLVPGIRSVDRAIGTGLDQLNRPLTQVTGVPRVSGNPASPGFPLSTATIVVRVTRP